MLCDEKQKQIEKNIEIIATKDDTKEQTEEIKN